MGRRLPDCAASSGCTGLGAAAAQAQVLCCVLPRCVCERERRGVLEREGGGSYVWVSLAAVCTWVLRLYACCTRAYARRGVVLAGRTVGASQPRYVYNQVLSEVLPFPTWASCDLSAAIVYIHEADGLPGQSLLWSCAASTWVAHTCVLHMLFVCLSPTQGGTGRGGAVNRDVRWLRQSQAQQLTTPAASTVWRIGHTSVGPAT